MMVGGSYDMPLTLNDALQFIRMYPGSSYSALDGLGRILPRKGASSPDYFNLAGEIHRIFDGEGGENDNVLRVLTFARRVGYTAMGKNTSYTDQLDVGTEIVGECAITRRNDVEGCALPSRLAYRMHYRPDIAGSNRGFIVMNVTI
jgi:hypothetical protein